MQELIKKTIQESIATKKALLTKGLAGEIEKGAARIIDSYRKKGKLLLCGNGGSAADAQHIAAELVGRFSQERPALPAIALNTNVSTLTSVGNDYQFEDIFSRQIEGFMEPDDVFIALSTSGNSPNVLKAAVAAKKIGGTVIGMTGSGGGKLKEHVDLLLNVPSEETPRIQESHILIGHILCDLVERGLFSPSK